jgi:multiple sugar transport system substrate-binding protein
VHVKAAEPVNAPARTRRSALLGLLAAAGTGTLAGCPAGVDSAASGHSADPGVITWYAVSVSQVQNDPRRILVDVFERDNLGLAVHEISANARTDAARENLRRAISAGGAEPDVYLGDVIWPADFAVDGVAAPLDERIGDLLGEKFWQRFADEEVTASRCRGNVYAAPFFADQGVLFYRADLVSEPPTTWQELFDLAKAAQRRSNPGMRGFVWQGDAYEGLTCCWTEFAAGAGMPVPTSSRPDSRLNTAETRHALEFLVRLVDEGVSPREVVRYQESQAMRDFNAGRAVFMRAWNGAWSSMNNPAISQVKGRVGVAPLPTFDGGDKRYSTVGGWSLFMNPNSGKRAAVARFVDWMTGPHAQKILARFSAIPANQRVRGDAELKRQYDPLRVAGTVTQVFRPSDYPNYAHLSRAIYINLNRALTRDVPPDAALRDAERQFDQARARQRHRC